MHVLLLVLLIVVSAVSGVNDLARPPPQTHAAAAPAPNHDEPATATEPTAQQQEQQQLQQQQRAKRRPSFKRRRRQVRRYIVPCLSSRFSLISIKAVPEVEESELEDLIHTESFVAALYHDSSKVKLYCTVTVQSNYTRASLSTYKHII